MIKQERTFGKPVGIPPETAEAIRIPGPTGQRITQGYFWPEGRVDLQKDIFWGMWVLPEEEKK